VIGAGYTICNQWNQAPNPSGNGSNGGRIGESGDQGKDLGFRRDDAKDSSG
jgi:hypothetical protein